MSRRTEAEAEVETLVPPPERVSDLVARAFEKNTPLPPGSGVRCRDLGDHGVTLMPTGTPEVESLAPGAIPRPPLLPAEASESDRWFATTVDANIDDEPAPADLPLALDPYTEWLRVARPVK